MAAVGLSANIPPVPVPADGPVTHLPAPLIVNWALSFRCNFDCQHCYTRLDRSPELSTDQVREALDRVAKAGVMFVNFGGGEPLLRQDIFAVSRHGADLGLRVSMNSNGSLVDAAIAAELARAGYASVGLSIDSHDPAVHDDFRNHPGSHRKAVQAAGYLKAAGLTVTISSVISRLNSGHLDELVRMAASLGASRLFLHNYKCSGKGLDNRFDLDLDPAGWRDFYREALSLQRAGTPVPLSFDDPIIGSLDDHPEAGAIKGSTCGKMSLNIRPNGDITPCGFLPMVLGNVLTDDLLTLWETSPTLDKMRHKTPTGKCRSCPSYADCLGGCTARAYAVTGEIDSPDPHCWHD
jgi:GeoRSP system radical SAM/SPASM protein